MSFQNNDDWENLDISLLFKNDESIVPGVATPLQKSQTIQTSFFVTPEDIPPIVKKILKEEYTENKTSWEIAMLNIQQLHQLCIYLQNEIKHLKTNYAVIREGLDEINVTTTTTTTTTGSTTSSPIIYDLDTTTEDEKEDTSNEENELTKVRRMELQTYNPSKKLRNN